MLKNYLKIAFRKLWKNKVHTAINMVGLAVAFGSSILLYLTASYEFSYDTFHKDADRVYCLYFNSADKAGKPEYSAAMAYPLTPVLKTEYPEVEAVTSYSWGAGELTYQEKKFEKNIQTVDADFLKVFSFPLLKGNINSALADKNNIVISKTTAENIFGKEEPIGKQVLVTLSNEKVPFIVTAVIDDAPKNSTVRYDALIRTEKNPGYEPIKDRWTSQNHQVYVKLAANTTQANAEKRFESLVNKYMKTSEEEAKKAGRLKNARGQYLSLLMMPLKEVHFDEITGWGSGMSKNYIYTLLTIALVIVLIASINFINLTIAKSFTQAKEVGVRKSLGANKVQLFLQGWGEAFMVCIVALILGLSLAYAFLPQFNKLFDSSLSIDNFLIPDNLIISLISFILITLIAGGYPAFVSSRFNIVQVLKGKLTRKKPGALRNSLIIVQFSISCILISCTLVIFTQLKYLRNKPLGYSKEQVISVPIGNALNNQTAVQQFRNELSKYPGIEAVSGSQINFGNGLDGSSSRSTYGFDYYPNASDTKNSKSILTDWVRVDYEFIKTMGIKTIEGRDFSPTFGTDSTALIVTESMLKQMGEKHGVDKFLMPDSAVGKQKIIGVIADFNLYSLRRENRTITLEMAPKGRVNYVLIRTGNQNLAESMNLVKNTWKKLAPNEEFKGSFINENVDRWFNKEERLSQIFSLAAGIAIMLSCMGLFAIALMIIEQRTKEIGVRKVLGASVSSIVNLISVDFLKMVGIAFVIATPVAYYAMQKWLQDFANRTDLNWWIFALAGVLLVVIALLTVSYQSIRAALMNPVKSLKTE
ncbi:ABC transporter permease [Emticicia agri]|uniref:ABC transporter permease n=1 Tax=Emticicia agri TaxID=2492393 RepID=A0A4Q5M6C2_9BACT|nr:ABC transporter permease [Emticicia agri]RYU97593.1 ABC transporter permease [Emticicia agri]